MKLFILKEPPGETRVATGPDAIKRLAGIGVETVVEAGAGDLAGMPDALLREAGATIATDRAAALAEADVIGAVRPPAPDSVAGAKQGALLIAFLSPYADTCL